MKRAYFIIAILFSCVYITTAQHLSELAMIDLNDPNLMVEFPFHSIEYKINPKQSAGVFFSIYISDIIEKRLPKASEEETKRYLIAIENDNGNQIFATYADFMKDNIKLDPVIILEKSKQYAKDTIIVHDKAIKKDKKQNLKAQKELMASLSKIFHLQIKKMQQQDIDKYFTKNSIIFPQDQSFYRWVDNAKVIKIYKIDY
jgi:hypothetical protein